MQEAPHCPPSSLTQHLLTVPVPSSSGWVQKGSTASSPPLAGELERPLTNGQPWSHAVSRCPWRPLRPSVNPLWDCPQNTHIHVVCGGKEEAACRDRSVGFPSHVVLTKGRGLLLSESQPLLDPSLPLCLSAAPSQTRRRPQAAPPALPPASILFLPPNNSSAFFCFLRTRCRCFPEFSSTSGSKFLQ